MLGTFAIVVTEKGGEHQRLDFDKGEVTIGRVQGNDIVLGKGNVSKRHARIVVKDGKFIIVDLNSTNGTYVNGRKITSPLVIKPTDKIYIGDFILGVEHDAVSEVSSSALKMGASVIPPPLIEEEVVQEPPPLPPAVTPPPVAVDPVPAPLSSIRAKETPKPAVPVVTGGGSNGKRVPTADLEPSRLSRTLGGPSATKPPHGQRPSKPLVVGGRAKREIQRTIVEYAVKKLELEDIATEKLGDESLWDKAERLIANKVAELKTAGKAKTVVSTDALVKDSLNEALGLGPLEELLEDSSVEEILVDKFDRVLARSEGRLQQTDRTFSSPESFQRVIERLVASSGYTIGPGVPLADIRLRDGSRLTVVIPPVAVQGPCLVLRKSATSVLTLGELSNGGVLSAEMVGFLCTCIEARRNILVCGGTGVGKGAIVSALASAVPVGERIISVEEVARLRMNREDWVALETPANHDGSSLGIGEVLRGALALRPDRLVVRDLRGAETYDLVSAMTSGRDGTILSVVGPSPEGALNRVAAMAGLLPFDMSVTALRTLVATAFDVVIHVVRYSDGTTRVASISEVLTTREGVQLQPLFQFRGEGATHKFIAAGVVPTFYAELEASGLTTDTGIFRT